MSETRDTASEQASTEIVWARHSFQDLDGVNRCIHCGQTLKNYLRGGKRRKKFWSFGLDCAVPEHWRPCVPSASDRFAVFAWYPSVGKFFTTQNETVDFISSEDIEGRKWVGPLILCTLQMNKHARGDYPRFADYIRARGALKRAADVSVEENWNHLVARGFAGDRTALAKHYLRDGWHEIEAAVNNRCGHFVENQAALDPYRALLAAATDFDDEFRERGISLDDAVNIWTSVQLHRHLEGFAGTQLACHGFDDDVLTRAVYWVLKDCDGYANTIWRNPSTPQHGEYAENLAAAIPEYASAGQPIGPDDGGHFKRGGWQPDRRAVIEVYERAYPKKNGSFKISHMFQKLKIKSSNGYAALRGNPARETEWNRILAHCEKDQPKTQL